MVFTKQRYKVGLRRISECLSTSKESYYKEQPDPFTGACLINDNNGELYKLGKNTEGLYISRNAYSEEEAKKLVLSYESNYAFVSSKSTGVLAMSIKEVSDDICLDPIKENNPNSHAVRAAFLSWGYLVRKAISSYLDIDASELNVGYT